MSLEIALKLAGFIAEQYAEREKAKKDDERAKKIIDSVVSAIKSSQKEIIDSMEQIRHRELAGKVLSLGLSLNDYRDVSNTVNFLDEVLSRSSEYEGEVKKEFDFNRSSDDIELALKEYSIYATLFSTRNLIMAEYKNKWGGDSQKIDCRILSEIDDTLNEGQKVENALRNSVMRRFTEVSVIDENPTEPGEVSVPRDIFLGYSFDLEFYDCYEKFSINPTFSLDQWAKCRDKRNDHIEKVFQDLAPEYIELRNTFQANRQLVSCSR